MLNVFWYELGQFVDVLKHFSHIDLLYLRRRELIAYTSPHSEISFARVFSHKLSSLKVWKVSDNGKSKILASKVYVTLTAKNWFLSKNESCREKPFVGVIYQPNPTLLSGNKRKTQKNVLSGKFILHCPILINSEASNVGAGRQEATWWYHLVIFITKWPPSQMVIFKIT